MCKLLRINFIIIYEFNFNAFPKVFSCSLANFYAIYSIVYQNKVWQRTHITTTS